MKRFSFLILLGLLQACDPYGFGFKMNPAFVLNEAFKSVLALDHEAFLDVSGKEALCLYGNPEGISYLRGNLNLDADKVEIKPKLIENSSKYTKAPHFVGYWSYYQEKYQINILDKATKDELLQVVVECHYGFEGEKKESYQNLKLKKYKMKECRVIKMIPLKFSALPLRDECQPLRVDL
jgi:hypothetical protein